MKSNWTKLAAAGAIAAGLVYAQTAPAKPPAQATAPAARRAMARRHRMMQSLNLTDAQKQQAKAIFQQARQTSQPVVQQLKQDRMALSAAVKANDNAKIQQLSAKEGKLRGEIMAVHASARAKFYQLLTPEQRAKADSAAARRHTTGA